jgi:hypothetical protein
MELLDFESGEAKKKMIKISSGNIANKFPNSSRL